jgi:hypothetical protein
MAQPQRTPSFESILDTPTNLVERPRPMPIGTYNCIVKGMYEEGVSSEKKTPFVRFTYAFQSAGDDVNEDELQAVLTDKDGVVHPLGEKTIKDTYYTTPDALYRITDVLVKMGVIDPDNDDGKTIRQALSETPNASIRIYVSHRTSTSDSQQIFADVKRTMRAED